MTWQYRIATEGAGVVPLAFATDGFLPFEVVQPHVARWPIHLEAGQLPGGSPVQWWKPEPEEEEEARVVDEQPRLTREEILALAARVASDGRLRPTVRQWAISIVRRENARTAREQIVALLRAVREQMWWVPSPVGAQWISPPDAQLLGGNCLEQSVKLAAGLLSIGIPCCLIAMAVDGEDDWNHAAVAAWDGGSWVKLDPARREYDVGEWAPAAREAWMLLPDQVLLHSATEATHRLRRQAKPRRLTAASIEDGAVIPLGLAEDLRRVRLAGETEGRRTSWSGEWAGVLLVLAAFVMLIILDSRADEKQRKKNHAERSREESKR